MYTYEFPKVADLTADIAVLRADSRLLLIRRRDEPFKGHWALPGGFFEVGETPLQAALRELREETSIEVGAGHMRQFRAYGGPHRDPRGPVLSVVHYTCVTVETEAKPQDDAVECQWFSFDDLPRDLAFDHGEIIHELLSSLGHNSSRPVVHGSEEDWSSVTWDTNDP